MRRRWTWALSQTWGVAEAARDTFPLAGVRTTPMQYTAFAGCVSGLGLTANHRQTHVGSVDRARSNTRHSCCAVATIRGVFVCVLQNRSARDSGGGGGLEKLDAQEQVFASVRFSALDLDDQQIAGRQGCATQATGHGHGDR
jgi:hypothetical protein